MCELVFGNESLFAHCIVAGTTEQYPSSGTVEGGGSTQAKGKASSISTGLDRTLAVLVIGSTVRYM